MEFGINLWCPEQSDVDMVAKANEYLEQVRLARDCGYKGVFYSEHFLYSPFRYFHLMTFLGRVVPEAGSMRIGTAVMLLPLHNPVEAAMMASTMDVLTRGRFVLGVGMGFREVEQEAFGMARTFVAEAFEERLDVLSRLLRGETVTHEGIGFHLKEARQDLPTVQTPQLPIWVGASGLSGIGRAAKFGDAWLISAKTSVSSAAEYAVVYERLLSENRRPLPKDRPMVREVVIRRSRKEAEGRASELAPMKALELHDTPSVSRRAIRGQKLGTSPYIVGAPGDVVESLKECVSRLGITIVVLRLQWPGMTGQETMRSIELIARDVIPQFAAR